MPLFIHVLAAAAAILFVLDHDEGVVVTPAVAATEAPPTTTTTTTNTDAAAATKNRKITRSSTPKATQRRQQQTPLRRQQRIQKKTKKNTKKHHTTHHPTRQNTKPEKPPKAHVNTEPGWGTDSALARHIKKIVIVIMENRAFDHMCGYLDEWGVPVDGANSAPPIVNTGPNGKNYTFIPGAPYVAPINPDHSINQSLEVYFGGHPWTYPVPLKNYITEHVQAGFTYHDAQSVLQGFKPDRVPALSTLAQQYTVFDKFFASLPGATIPNRVFTASGRSGGISEELSDYLEYFRGLDFRTMFEVVMDHGLSWATYYEDLPDLFFYKNLRERDHHFKLFRQFKKDAAAGKLPYLTWVSPSFYINLESLHSSARDQHPSHDVTQGEHFIREVYEAVRNGPHWNETMLIFTHDEGGGFFDHVSPRFVPNPDGIDADASQRFFNFTVTGPRVCTLVVSPWAKKGHVIGDPVETNKSLYEFSSFYSTIRSMHGWDEELSKRTAVAASMETAITDTLRSEEDCPRTIPAPELLSPAELVQNHERIKNQEPNDLQMAFIRYLHSALNSSEEEKNRFFKSLNKISEGTATEEAVRLVRRLFPHLDKQ